MVRARPLSERAPAQPLAAACRDHPARASATSPSAARPAVQEPATARVAHRHTSRQPPAHPRVPKAPRRLKQPHHRRAKATHLRLKAEAAPASDISVRDGPPKQRRSPLGLGVRDVAAHHAGSLQRDRRRSGTVARPGGGRACGQIPRLLMPHAVGRKRAGRRMERIDDRHVLLRRKHLLDGWRARCRGGGRGRTHGQHGDGHMGVQRAYRCDARGGDTLAGRRLRRWRSPQRYLRVLVRRTWWRPQPRKRLWHL